MRSRLAREAGLLGPARIQGRLYDLGSYPGLIVSSTPADNVFGEIFELRDPAQTLPWLDAYEGIGSPITPDDHYVRETHTVWIDAEPATAWVYLYNGDLKLAQRISGGRWRAHQA